MIIWGSTPDALAQQRNFYDSMNATANRDNANAASQAQQAQVQLAIGQQQAQQAAQQHGQDQNFQAWQNALQRQSATNDVAMQYSGARADLAIKQNEQDFNNAVKDAMAGALPADAGRLSTLYPHFNPSQINQIYQIAGSASVERLRQAATQTDSAHQAPTTDMIDAAGVPPGTDFEKQAHAIVTSLRAPYESDYAKSQQLADSGNAVPKIQALQTPVPGTPQPSAWNYLNPEYLGLKVAGALDPAVPAASVVQPSDAATSRLALLAKAAADNAASKSPSISGQPGTYASALPSAWRPAQAPTTQQPAPVPQAPAPPAPPPAQRVAGQQYSTPVGIKTWTGTGWI